ncbi:class I SAM-dependent methyltransferase [Thermococcus sp. M36]|uniref:class I SAM-dependent methyltransferase n=1 Tax=Thermococcus sp. M36 TaxID=1638261 RepID=UPI00143B5C7F|nr:class I SAM-dependent methyltransferase [Thermococcus sp. M36]NJE04884.1 class I SAM-dependent methyltransferase [Thermococcus sp. M36]
MEPLRVFYSEALKHFEEAGGSEEDFMWLVGSRLAWFRLYRDEIRLRLRMIEEVSRRIRGRVLDVGSGTGFPALVMALSGNAEEIVGLEKDPYMVEFSKRLEKHAPNLRFVEGDFLDRNVKLGKFDTVVFMYVLHDFEPEGFLRQTLEVLRSGGRVVVADFDLNGLRERVKDIGRAKGLELFDDISLGRAMSHGKLSGAFLMVLRRDESEGRANPDAG